MGKKSEKKKNGNKGLELMLEQPPLEIFYKRKDQPFFILRIDGVKNRENAKNYLSNLNFLSDWLKDQDIIMKDFTENMFSFPINLESDGIFSPFIWTVFARAVQGHFEEPGTRTELKNELTTNDTWRSIENILLEGMGYEYVEEGLQEYNDTYFLSLDKIHSRIEESLGVEGFTTEVLMQVTAMIDATAYYMYDLLGLYRDVVSTYSSYNKIVKDINKLKRTFKLSDESFNELLSLMKENKKFYEKARELGISSKNAKKLRSLINKRDKKRKDYKRISSKISKRLRFTYPKQVKELLDNEKRREFYKEVYDINLKKNPLFNQLEQEIYERTISNLVRKPLFLINTFSNFYSAFKDKAPTPRDLEDFLKGFVYGLTDHPSIRNEYKNKMPKKLGLEKGIKFRINRGDSILINTDYLKAEMKRILDENGIKYRSKEIDELMRKFLMKIEREGLPKEVEKRLKSKQIIFTPKKNSAALQERNIIQHYKRVEKGKGIVDDAVALTALLFHGPFGFAGYLLADTIDTLGKFTKFYVKEDIDEVIGLYVKKRMEEINISNKGIVNELLYAIYLSQIDLELEKEGELIKKNEVGFTLPRYKRSTHSSFKYFNFLQPVPYTALESILIFGQKLNGYIMEDVIAKNKSINPKEIKDRLMSYVKSKELYTKIGFKKMRFKDFANTYMDRLIYLLRNPRIFYIVKDLLENGNRSEGIPLPPEKMGSSLLIPLPTQLVDIVSKTYPILRNDHH